MKNTQATIYQTNHRINWFQKFLLICSGGNIHILRKTPSEWNKFAGIGGIVLFTAVFATLSAAYAMFTIFDDIWASIGFGILWGLMIFNLDRYIVSSIKKTGSWWNQILMSIPRLILATFLGIIISKPLELKIFEKEIAVKMHENLHHKIQNNDSLLQIENKLLMQDANAERQRLTVRKSAVEDSLAQLQSAYIREADGTGGSGRRGIEKLTHLKMDAYNQALLQFAPELRNIDSSVKAQDGILSSAKSDLEQKRKDYALTAGANQGFLEKNKALADLSDQESSVWWTSTLLSLLIILIEIGPILSKLIMPVGPYDIALAKEELLQMAEDENAMRKSKEVMFEKRKTFYQKQKEMSDDLVNKLTDLQKKHIDEELEKWDRGEWSSKDHRASMDEVMRKIKEKYNVNDEDLL